MKKYAIVLGLALLTLGFAAPSMAGETTVEGFLGYYDPDSLDDHGEIFGARVGYRPSDNFGMLLSAGGIDLEDDFLGIDESNLRADLFLIDFSFQWFPSGSGFYLFAGPGWATVDVKVDFAGPSNNVEVSDDIFTVHGGIGYKWNIGDSFFIRPEGRARWFDGEDFAVDEFDSYEGLDTEYSLGLGWAF